MNFIAFYFPDVGCGGDDGNGVNQIRLGVPNKPIVVVEDQFLRMRCAAGGQPRPEVVWYRLDGRPITDGAWQGNLR